MPTGSLSWSTTTSIRPTWIRWCGRCARASSRAKASKSCAVAGARCSTPWPMATTIRAMRASSSMPVGRGRGATPFRSSRARARNSMPASVPNGRMFCRADKRARTLPRYLAPSLMTARTSAMPSGRFPSRNDATSAAFAVSTPAKPGSPTAEEPSEPTLADIGARVGEENEALRNLLIDTDRRIGALDDLKDAFRSLVEPIGSALQALEQEKTDNVGLRNALAELRAGHESVRSEFSALEKRAAELESTG